MNRYSWDDDELLGRRDRTSLSLPQSSTASMERGLQGLGQPIRPPAPPGPPASASTPLTPPSPTRQAAGALATPSPDVGASSMLNGLSGLSGVSGSRAPGPPGTPLDSPLPQTAGRLVRPDWLLGRLTSGGLLADPTQRTEIALDQAPAGQAPPGELGMPATAALDTNQANADIAAHFMERRNREATPQELDALQQQADIAPGAPAH